MKNYFLKFALILFIVLNTSSCSNDNDDDDLQEIYKDKDITDNTFSSYLDLKYLFDDVFKNDFQILSSLSPTDENIFSVNGPKSNIFMDQFSTYFTPDNNLIYFEFVFNKDRGDIPFLAISYLKNGYIKNWIDPENQKIEIDLIRKKIKVIYKDEKGDENIMLLDKFKILESNTPGYQKFYLEFEMIINDNKKINWKFKNI
ncbi:hypothetical protein [Apibacter sp. wkB309]|uniref:hypothetical protein n=1 Tax=Apibacter sp. wkB309 TaxID=1679467 RepID=UPI000CF87DB8|nr:hypothetical protein [Apibacter sp. wkB309]PQL90927.1 hypothetical protein C4S75_05520 [Apibacter sp. wkB309]